MTRGSFFTACLFSLLTLGTVPAWAELSAEASLSNQEVMTGEAFQLFVQVTDDKKEELPWPQVQGLDPFQVSKSTSMSSSSQTRIQDGHISQNNAYVTTFTYTLTASKAGIYSIGPIRYEFKEFHTDLGSASVTVTKSVAGLSTQSILSKRKAYVGEQVLYTLRIMAKENVQAINPPDSLQKLIGEKFYFEPLDKSITPRAETVNGQQVRVFDFHFALFPLLAGTANLEGIPVNYQVIRQRRSGEQSMFDMLQDNFFSGANVITQKAMAEPLKMEAVELPSGAPAGFTGSVGQYTLSAKVDKSSVAAGDAVSLTITLRGNGQPKSMTKPVMPDLQDFETFDPEESSSNELQGNTLWTTKVFKYVLVPHRQGDYKLSGISFPYFDPDRGAYAKAESAPIEIQVSPGKEGSAPLAPMLTQNEITDLGSDIRHIKTDVAELENQGDLPYHHPWFGGLFLLSPLACAGALALRRRRDRLRSDSAFLRKTRAGSKMRRRFKEAQQALTAGKPREFYHEVSEAVIGFASDALNQEFRGMTLSEAKEALARRGAKPETLAAYESLMHRCDFGQFAGLHPSSDELKGDLETASKLLEQLDRELR